MTKILRKRRGGNNERVVGRTLGLCDILPFFHPKLAIFSEERDTSIRHSRKKALLVQIMYILCQLAGYPSFLI